MSHKYVYLFSEGNGKMRELLGGKGANLAEMTNLGMPVPQGFTITTEACTQYYNDGKKINDEIQEEIFSYLAKLEEISGKKFGDVKNPLLVSVRSGARASMPGMMDTILNHLRRLLGRRHRQLGVAVGAQHLVGLQVPVGVEAPDLRRQGRLISCRVKLGDGTDAVFTGLHPLPGLPGGVP